MKKYKITIAYDGSNYHGWQIQPDAPTITGVLQKQYHDIFGHTIDIVGSSRTDAGVHALGQIASFSSDLEIDTQKMMRVWNARLPKDILIRSLEPVAADFHPQADVLQKTYYYHFSQHRPLPFISRYVYFYKLPVALDQMHEALNHFVGTHDFRSFCTGYEQEHTIRTVDSIDLEYLKRYGVCRVTVKGPGFLRYMIRRMVGASLHVASYPGRSVQEIPEALGAKNPLQQLPTAPAHGLLLRKIVYK